ncbi:peptidoglycan editing factor PgeF [Pseudoduganella violaceinigra]|uniref:peptidoglycan editing factor PgeF n=1 Tax=Pseudoduganella violaceinigra TaxID=246602 RepID=UPI00040F4E32|nr:peptidoglycan editing factor PgeF [Pseudoduganella violaceinigra]
MQQTFQGAQWLLPDWPGAPANIGVVCTTRRGGVSPEPYGAGPQAIANAGGGLNLGVHVGDDPANVAFNRAILKGRLPSEPAWLSQVHGTAVVRADLQGRGRAPQADASIALMPGAVCVIQTADCLPVLLTNRAGTAVGAAHAGWRSLAGGVLEATVAAMRAEAGGDEIVAWLGPAIGPQEFEVGDDVLAAFLQGAPDDAAVRAAFKARPGLPGKYLADIYALARLRLAGIGVRDVAGGDLCTVTDASRFYSYRRDKVTGRQASLIWIKQ